MAKRANRMTLDTNHISKEGLQVIKYVIDSEQKIATDKKAQMCLLLESAFLHSVILKREVQE